ncbi:unnamed protein product [Oikopleura dioica]|uniref:Protein kinase C n=1 Tax=Oikopleura dioica TaxID=34765 RepID=E4XMX4_OIKDI|nr:unnamed protein product [Oikopleura dioica]
MTVVYAKVKLNFRSDQYTFHIDSRMNFDDLVTKVEEMCGLARKSPLVLKYIDEDNDPIVVFSDEEMEEMLRITQPNDSIHMHAFNCRSPEPGKRCDGETKDIYRRNAMAKIKHRLRHLGRKNNRPLKPHEIPVLDHRSQAQPVQNAQNAGPTPPGGRKLGMEVAQDPSVQRGFNFHDFELIKVIGRGSYAKVLLVRLHTTKRLYAMKVIKKELVCDEEDIDWVQTEKHVFETASNHPFLVGLHSCFQSPSRLFFVIEYINGGDLMFHMQKQRKLPEEHARFYSAEISLALHFLHERGIIYRDLKLDNVLLDSEGHIRLTDYGMCKEGISRPTDVATTFCGTPNYIAPEILRCEDYRFSVDWWALGVLMYEMMAGRSPFDTGPVTNQEGDQNTEEILFQVILERVIRIPRSLSVRAGKVLKGFLNKDPNDRLGCIGENGFQDIINHEFFRSIDWQLLESKQISPPYKPYIRDEMGLDNFDTQFTEEPAQLTPDVNAFRGNEFEGFEYVNPLLMTVEDQV